MGYVLRSLLVAEQALGRPIDVGMHIHHVDGDSSNDENHNLVICENAKYHTLLHQRTRAYQACGHSSWRKCWICKAYDHPFNLYVNERFPVVYHRACYSQYERNTRASGERICAQR
jgi:hypothetical protein